MVYVIVVILLIGACWLILQCFGVFEQGIGAKKLASDIKEERNLNRHRKRENKKLGLYALVCNTFRGILLNETQYQNYKFYIDRLEIKSEVLDRLYTPEELRGRNFMFTIGGCLFIPLIFFNPIFAVFTIAGIIVSLSFGFKYKSKIAQEDEIIDTYFNTLFLMMYSKLRMGSKARLQTVVESYVKTLDVASNHKMKEVMLKFSRYFLNNLNLYEDHLAVPKLRERYRSALIVNFCNIASQALQGIDNGDTLLSLKMDLTRREVAKMNKKCNDRVEWGSKAIYLVYGLLFVFIVVGWYSKLPGGFF